MRITPLARRLGSAALVLTLGTGLAACGGSDESSDSTSASDSSDDSAESTDESTDDSGDDATQSAPEELSADDFYSSVMDAMREAETFSFTTTTSGQAGAAAGTATEMSGQARFGDDGIEMQASSTGAQAMEIILLDQVMYMKAPEMGTGDKYLEIDLSDPSSLFGMLGKATDPEVIFQAMEKPKSLELVGQEDVDGVATNHYRITIDPAKYLEAMDFPASMAEFVPDEMVTEMWVDGDNLPRKFAQTVETPNPSGGEPVSSTTEGTYTDFGTEVDIQAPAKDEISTEQIPGMS